MGGNNTGRRANTLQQTSIGGPSLRRFVKSCPDFCKKENFRAAGIPYVTLDVKINRRYFNRHRKCQDELAHKQSTNLGFETRQRVSVCILLFLSSQILTSRKLVEELKGKYAALAVLVTLR